MCGIVGAISKRDVSNILLEGLKRLEYRGYDSAGMAVLSKGLLERIRRPGKVAELGEALASSKLTGAILFHAITVSFLTREVSLCQPGSNCLKPSGFCCDLNCSKSSLII